MQFMVSFMLTKNILDRRGIGDCWTHEEYVWTGKKLEKSSVGSTGLCRNIAAGGAWRLPTFVSKVKLK